ncbi:MAG: glycoside hydrolase family 9 protein [Fibrobacterota bacterium]
MQAGTRLLLIVILLQTISAETVLRFNHLGYAPGEQKRAFLCALDGEEIENLPFGVYRGDSAVFSGQTGAPRPVGGTAFSAVVPLDFTDLQTEGTYTLRVEGGPASQEFVIGGAAEYTDALMDILHSFRSQRCGDNNPAMHEPCHLSDTAAAVDVTGGWHDAGDYIKFMVTASFVTVNMLTTLEYGRDFMDEAALPADREDPAVPDLAEEARIGLEWMLKMTAAWKDTTFYMQVSDGEDHNHWRLPETDDITGVVGTPRDLYEGWGNNLNGRCIAAFAMASRLYAEYDSTFAATCLNRAEALWQLRDLYTEPSESVDFYKEWKGSDDMVLGALELYRATGNATAKTFAKENFSVIKKAAISWASGEFLSLASAWRADIGREYAEMKMRNHLNSFRSRAENHAMGLSSGMTWGSTSLFTAQAQMAAMYYYLTEDPQFLPMAEQQRDYLLGANNWGTTFIVGVGHRFPRFAHSQLNDLVGLQTGAVVGGPTAHDNYENQEWLMEQFEEFDDPYEKFQGNEVYYDFMPDYITNEVAIDYASSALFLMMHTISQAKRGTVPAIETVRPGTGGLSLSLLSNGQGLNLSAQEDIRSCALYSPEGRQLYSEHFGPAQRSVHIGRDQLPAGAGIFLLRITGASGRADRIIRHTP